MNNNVLNNINFILAAMGSKPYSIKKLTAGDLLKLNNYFIGLEILIKSLQPHEHKTESGKSVYFSLDIADAPNNLLYRASSDKHMASFLFTPGERVSQGTQNIYNRLISDILPSWKDIPKRSNSVVCANDYSVAEDYIEYSTRESGIIYVVIPPNNAKLVVSPKDDVWYAFRYIKAKTGVPSLKAFNNSILEFLAFIDNFINNEDAVQSIKEKSSDISELMERVKMMLYINRDKYEHMFLNGDRSTILNAFKAIDALLSDREVIDGLIYACRTYYLEEPLTGIGGYILKQKMMFRTSMIDILNELFDPHANGFEVIDYSTFIKKDYIRREVWTEDPCIFIELENRKFLTELYKKYTDTNKKEI